MACTVTCDIQLLSLTPAAGAQVRFTATSYLTDGESIVVPTYPGTVLILDTAGQGTINLAAGVYTVLVQLPDGTGVGDGEVYPKFYIRVAEDVLSATLQELMLAYVAESDPSADESTVDSVVEVLATSKTAGRAATVSGQYYAVAGADPFAPSLKRYKRKRTAEVLVNDPYLPPVGNVLPNQPPTSAAIITASSTLQQLGVPLKMLMGRNYNSGNDGHVTFGAYLSEIAQSGLFLSDADGADIQFGAGVDLPSNLRIKGTGKSRIRRNWSETGSSNALFTGGTQSARISNLSLEGLTFDMVDETANIDRQGSFFTIYCDDTDFIDLTFKNWQQGHVLFGRGDRCTARGIRFDTPDLDASVESAGWRWSEGEYCTFQISYGRASNDVLMWVVPVTRGGTEWLRHCRYVDCVTYSDRAKGLGTMGASENGGAVELANPQVSDSQFLGGLYACGFDGCRSPYAGSNFYRIIADGSGRRNMIDQCYIRSASGNLVSTNAGTDGLEIEGLDELTWNGSAWVASGSGYGSVGTIILDGVVVTTSNTRDTHVWTAPGARIIASNMKVNGDRTAAKIDVGAKGVVQFDGDIDFTGLNTSDGSGDANQKHVVKIASGNVDFNCKPIIRGLPTGKAAFNIEGGRVRMFRGAECHPAPGATGTEFAKVSSGATLEYLDDITGTIATLVPSGSGTIRKLPAAGLVLDPANFTPVLADASTGGVVATGSISGTWAQIGKTVKMQIRGSNIVTTGMAGGNALYIRWPTGAGAPPPVRTGNANNVSQIVSTECVTYTGILTFWGEAGTSYGRIWQNTSGAAATRTALTVAALTTTTADIYVDFTYLTD